jgi:hypothetical protein
LSMSIEGKVGIDKSMPRKAAASRRTPKIQRHKDTTQCLRWTPMCRQKNYSKFFSSSPLSLSVKIKSKMWT